MAIHRTFQAIDPAGTSHSVKVIISEPHLDPQGDIYVSLCLLGLDKESHTVHGSDSWQAIALAMQTARDRLYCFADMGWKFLWDKESAEDMDHELHPEDMDESWAET